MVVDSDVHCAVPSVETLYPYLSGHWPEFLRTSEIWKHHGGANAYPEWSTMLATDGKALTLERLEADVLDGVDAAVLHCHYGVDSVTHPYLSLELQRAVNQWVRDEWLERDQRLFGTISINPNYVDDAVAEIERAAEHDRFVQVALPVRSREEYGHPRYWPIWETAARRGLAVAFTYGGASGQPPTTVNWMGSTYEDYVVATLSFAPQIMSVLVSGILSNWPELRIVAVESGWAWVPGFSWRMDAEWKAHAREIPWVKEPPSAYMRRHFRFTTQPADLPDDPEQVEQALEQLGNDEVAPHELLLYSSDYPHRYGRGIEHVVAGMTAGQRDRVMGENALEWYGLGDRIQSLAI